MHGQLHRLQHESTSLQGNRLGDPSTRDVYVYTPPSYDGKLRFGTVMMLAGYGSTHHSIVSWNPWQPNTVELFDAMVARGDCPPALLVLPDCFNRWGGSQFLDSPATGAYQTYLADEIIPFVDAQFRTVPKREARAVVGRSSGGFGALRLGMDRPDAVAVVGSHAGDAAFEISMRPMFTKAAIAFEQAGGLEAFAAAIPGTGPKDAAEYDAIFVLAASAAYAPEPDGPAPFTRLPFDPTTAELRPDIWARWLAHDPVTLLDSRAEALRQLSLVFVDAGDRDEHGLQFGARALHAGLQRLSVPVRYEQFAGTHRGTAWRYEVSLPVLIAGLQTS